MLSGFTNPSLINFDQLINCSLRSIIAYVQINKRPFIIFYY